MKKHWSFTLTIACIVTYSEICAAGIYFRAPYWHLSPNVAPDFSAQNVALMWTALVVFPLSLVAIIWQALMVRHDRLLQRKAIYSSVSLISLYILFALIFRPATMSGFYEPSYCAYNQKAIYQEVLSYVKAHNGLLPKTITELPKTTYRDGCIVRTSWLLPPVRKPYALNNTIAGKKLADIPDAEHIILLADSRSHENLHSIDDIDWERHHHAYVVLFCDGHVEILYLPDKSLTLNPDKR